VINLKKIIPVIFTLILIFLVIGCIEEGTSSNGFTNQLTFEKISVKEINQYPQTNMGLTVELEGVVFPSWNNETWFEFTDDERNLDRYRPDEYDIIYIYNTVGFNVEQQLESNPLGHIVVKGIVKQDEKGAYIEANSIILL
jgi:hypothetical protein